MVEPLFLLKNVFYSYPGKIPALRDINIEINAGDRIAVIGANGTGKSTLLTLLDALIFAGAGSVHAQGKAITEKTMNDAAFQRQFRSKVGFVFQNPDIQLFCPTVREDIVFGPYY
jgi:cobalt/nickel transport system ATP-binding protein